MKGKINKFKMSKKTYHSKIIQFSTSVIWQQILKADSLLQTTKL